MESGGMRDEQSRTVKISSRYQGAMRNGCLKALRAQVFYDEPATCAIASIGHAFWPL